jgi:putative transposase
LWSAEIQLDLRGCRTLRFADFGGWRWSRKAGLGRKVADLCRANGITEQTYYHWKAKYGGMELSEMQRLKQLKDENRRLKQIVAEQTLDIQALKAVVAKR